MKWQELRFYLVVGLFFVLAGLLLGSQHMIRYWQNKSTQTAFYQTAVAASKKPTLTGLPTHIDIPNVGISVDIEKGYYLKSSQTWTLSTTKAEYATVTPEPNNASGNTFIYGHNRWEVFYKLLNVRPGDEAIVTTDNHHEFIYKMVSQKVTKPSDTSLFRYQGPPILTLQTCSGFWYQNRSLFVFNLVQAT